jgi:hypothetical protein
VVQVRLAFEILILHCTKLHCTTTDILSPLLTIVFVVCSLSLALRGASDGRHGRHRRNGRWWTRGRPGSSSSD